MAATTDYINDGQQRLVSLLLCLADHPVDGLAPGQIADHTKASPSQVTRDLANLQHRGWAEQLPNTQRWRLGPQVVQIALQHMAAIDRAQRRLDETRNRFSRTDG